MPQLLGSLVVSTHAPLQSVNVPPQAWPQAPPSHVTKPASPLGATHGEHDEIPQEPVNELLTHVVPQTWWPAGQSQLPASQKPPPAHEAPQALQLLGSVIVFTQVVGLATGQAVSPGHVKPHAPASHAATPPDGVLQGEQELPQFSELAGHWQAPPSQNPPPAGHPWAQLPQFRPSVAVFTHALVHRFGNVALLQEATQLVPEHAVVPFVGDVGQAAQVFPQFAVLGGQLLHTLALQPFGHVRPHPAQFFASLVVLISQPFPASLSQSANPVVQDDTPQVDPAHASTALFVLHGLVQLPQWVGSFVVFTHTAVLPVPQSVANAALLQVMPQAVPLQVALPFMGAGQAVHDVPHEFVEVLLEQVVPHRWVPAGQAHADRWQVIPPVHWLLHAPQLFGSLVMSTHCPLAPLPQSVWPVGQMQVPLWQTSLDRQALPHPPQLPWSVIGSTHVAVTPVPHWMEPAAPQAVHALPWQNW
jgi:hypothetical protein